MKGLKNRAYNIFFHTHTVSGIVISTALYVIFFAGAFTLFKSEFYLWENPSARNLHTKSIDINAIFKAISRDNPKLDINEDLYLSFPTENNPLLNIYGHLQPDKNGKEVHFTAKLNPETYKTHTEGNSTIGETLYRLHFLDQIPMLGRWLAGFVSFFFIFATITGVLIHWKNIFSKFWGFSLRGTLKQVWTNAHTVFGLIGLPFQLMYAVTGAFYLLLLLVLMPAVMFFYNGKPDKIYAMVYPYMGITYNEAAAVQDNLPQIEKIYKQVAAQYASEHHLVAVNTRHVGKADGTINFRLRSRNPRMLISYGYLGFRLSDGKELYRSMPGPNKTYVHSVVEAIGQLHFASFGGLLTKALYFLMALFTCFVIISGILLWKRARLSASYSEKQKRFHHRVTMVYLAICIGLFPAVAFLFNAELMFKGGDKHNVWVESAFFLFWLLLVTVGLLFKTEKKQTHFYMLVAGILAVLIPITNGICTGDWFWKTFASGQIPIFSTDIFWLITGVASLVMSRDLLPKKVVTREQQVVVPFA